MKTDKKSRVPLFTFPPPLLAALFLLADCHYKALQGTVGAIGDWAWSQVTQPHASNTSTFTHTHASEHATHTCVLLSHTHTQAHADAHMYICTHVKKQTQPRPPDHKHNATTLLFTSTFWRYSTNTNV